MPVIRHKYTCFTFNTPVLPSAIKMHSLGLIVRGTFRIHVVVYIANNMVNHEVKCKNDPVCTRCGQPAINHASLHKKTLRSVPNAVKATMLTQRNTRPGKRKKKYLE